MLPDLSSRTVFLLGGGPSLLNSIAELEERYDVGKYYIIAINESIYATLYANMLFFRDTTWYLGNKEFMDTWIGCVVTSTASRFYGSNVNIVKIKHVDRFLVGSDTIKFGRSSGHIALSLAISLGANKCVLLGYDCRIVDGRSHFHDKPSEVTALGYKEYFLPAWVGWGDAVEAAGVEVVNATPGSAILSFPRRPLSEVLAE
jgi:hypothetical protein